MPPSPLDYLWYILDEANYLLAESNGLTYARSVQNETLKRAFVRSLEIIGEAAKKTPSQWRQKYPDVEWRSMPILGRTMRSCGMWS